MMVVYLEELLPYIFSLDDWSQEEIDDRIEEYERNTKEFFKRIGFTERRFYGDFVVKPLMNYDDVMHVCRDRGFFNWDLIVCEPLIPIRCMLMSYIPELPESDKDVMIGMRMDRVMPIKRFNREVWPNTFGYDTIMTVMDDINEALKNAGGVVECLKANVKPSHIIH